MQSTLSIIVPCYNEEANIRAILERLLDIDLPYGIEREILVVDDGSADNSASIVERLIQETGDNTPLSLIRHQQNMGKGMAIRTAIKHLSGNYAVIQDGDMEYCPDDISRMLKVMIDENLPVLYGSRQLGHINKNNLSSPFFWGGKLVTLATNLIYGLSLTDEPTCYKMFTSELLKSIPLNCTGFEFCPEVTAKIALRGISIKEVPIKYTPRSIKEGKKIKWTDGVEAISLLLRLKIESLKGKNL